MKAFIVTLALLGSVAAQAAAVKHDYKNQNCKDANLNGLGSTQYDTLKFRNRFKQLLSVDSPAPAGFEMFAYEGEICYATKATYLKHKSGKVYVMYTTHDDYCDGGNTLGVMVDTEIYRDKKSIQDSIVAEIGDSQFSCVAK